VRDVGQLDEEGGPLNIELMLSGLATAGYAERVDLAQKLTKRRAR
jgi:hypothetical protein